MSWTPIKMDSETCYQFFLPLILMGAEACRNWVLCHVDKYVLWTQKCEKRRENPEESEGSPSPITAWCHWIQPGDKQQYMWATKQLLLYLYLPVANKISFVKSWRNRDLSVKASRGTLIRLNVDRQRSSRANPWDIPGLLYVCLLELLLRKRERILNHFVYWKLFQKYFQWECILRLLSLFI